MKIYALIAIFSCLAISALAFDLSSNIEVDSETVTNLILASSNEKGEFLTEAVDYTNMVEVVKSMASNFLSEEGGHDGKHDASVESSGSLQFSVKVKADGKPVAAVDSKGDGKEVLDMGVKRHGRITTVWVRGERNVTAKTHAGNATIDASVQRRFHARVVAKRLGLRESIEACIAHKKAFFSGMVVYRVQASSWSVQDSQAAKVKSLERRGAQATVTILLTPEKPTEVYGRFSKEKRTHVNVDKKEHKKLAVTNGEYLTEIHYGNN